MPAPARSFRASRIRANPTSPAARSAISASPGSVDFAPDVAASGVPSHAAWPGDAAHDRAGHHLGADGVLAGGNGYRAGIRREHPRFNPSPSVHVRSGVIPGRHSGRRTAVRNRPDGRGASRGRCAGWHHVPRLVGPRVSGWELDDPVVRNPDGEVVARDGEIIKIPRTAEMPSLHGHDVCATGDSIYVMLYGSEQT